MSKKTKLALLFVSLLGAALLAYVLTHRHDIDVFNPAGIIASKERRLMTITLLMSLIVIIPVYALMIMVSVKYRAENKKATYSPDWDHNRLIEFIWWAIPCAIILFLGILTWTSTHELDPFRAINSDKKPLTVQVVALQWKWLFIYPEQHIASVNHFEIPEKTPINFEITSDAPMNSFWIPRLGGQVYAMSGMSTQLHLMANDPGVYRGVSANISGKGFAGMDFTAQAVTSDNFKAWVTQAQHAKNTLNLASYTQLANPSENNLTVTYSDSETGLYDTIIMKYMSPVQTQTGYAK
jgi:cytochrome o ubiquinol oxidase subunit 2